MEPASLENDELPEKASVSDLSTSPPAASHIHLQPEADRRGRLIQPLRVRPSIRLRLYIGRIGQER